MSDQTMTETQRKVLSCSHDWGYHDRRFRHCDKCGATEFLDNVTSQGKLSVTDQGEKNETRNNDRQV